MTYVTFIISATSLAWTSFPVELDLGHSDFVQYFQILV